MYSEHSAAIAAPPNRRRRPALSCLHCRSRKVRCDQKKPCSQCKRSKDVTCTYTFDFNTSPSHGNPQTQVTPKNHPQAGQNQSSQEDMRIPTPNPPYKPPSTGPSICSEVRSLEGSHVKSLKPKVIDHLSSFKDELPEKNRFSYMTYAPEIERHVVTSDLVPIVGKEDRCRLKMKLVGEAHWFNQLWQFDKILASFAVCDRTSENPSEVRLLLRHCKQLAKTIKAERPLTPLSHSDFKLSLPSKDICDELVGNYLRNYESVCRIIHIPSFLTRYYEFWSNPEGENNRCIPFVTQFALILAIGSAFQQHSVDKPSIRLVARQWVFTAHQWHSTPVKKTRVNITGLQIQCLLALAREAVGIGSDLLWISSGSLLRTAMQLGYHRDPKHYPGLSIFHSEMRRRLWATVIELGIKESFGMAMPPLVSMSDFDTEPPCNINDSDICPDTKIAPKSEDLTTFTQTTLQIILLQSLQNRLELARSLANFRSELSYDEVLRLHSQITSAWRKAQSYKINSSNPSLTPFQYNYIDFIMRWPLISLHRPWAAKARTDPRFYFSRKVCLDISLAVMSFSPSTDYSRLLTVGNGVWRDIVSLPPITIAYELIMQLEEEALNPPSEMQAAHAKKSRAPLLQSLRDSVVVKRERLLEGETNVKGYLFTRMTLGQIEATEKGENVEEGILKAAIGSLQDCSKILEEKVAMIPKADTADTADPETPLEEENQYYRDTGDMFNYGNLLDLGLDFDMVDSTIVGDWDMHY